MSDIECPYCGHEQDVCQDDGHACEDSRLYEEECRSCEKLFALTPSISFDFYVKKCDCMNGGPHKWVVNKYIYEGKMKYRRCEDCGESEYFLETQEAG